MQSGSSRWSHSTHWPVVKLHLEKVSTTALRRPEPPELLATASVSELLMTGEKSQLAFFQGLHAESAMPRGPPPNIASAMLDGASSSGLLRAIAIVLVSVPASFIVACNSRIVCPACCPEVIFSQILPGCVDTSPRETFPPWARTVTFASPKRKRSSPSKYPCSISMPL